MINQGDIVFFRKAKKSGKVKTPEATFKGHGFGIFLGHAPLFAPDPPAFLILRMLGQVGFVSFDDVKTMLGEDQLEILSQKYKTKYWGEEVVQIQKEATERATRQEVLKSQMPED